MGFKYDVRVLDWLGLDERGLGYYLSFLNLRYTVSSEALSRLRQVARQLELEPDYWKQIIREPLWRTQLIGCYALLITQNKNYLEPLKTGLSRNSFISPQVAVTLGMLHPTEALAYLQQWLNPNSVEDPKRTAAAYQVLLKLGSSNAEQFDIETFRDKPHPTSRYRDDSYWRNDFDIGKGVAQAHWDAWQQIISKNENISPLL
jgi:hypothetical protein